MTIVKKIKDMRLRYGYRQANLAEKIGCSKQVVSNIERGETSVSADLAVRIAAVFRVPVDEILSAPGAGSASLSKEEYWIVSEYRKMLPEERELLIDLCKFMTFRRKDCAKRVVR